MNKHKAEKLKYKQTPIPAGVYQVKNTINGKVLVGSSPNVHGKINSIKFQLEAGSHKNKDLQSDWDEYGEKSFLLEVLEILKPSEEPLRNNREDLKALEEIWLERVRPYGEMGYNKIKH